MSDTHPALALYTRALDDFEAALTAVPADAWENQSPCTEWKTLDVADHVIGVQRHVVATLTGAEGSRPGPRELVGSDPVAAFRAVCAELADAVAVPGVLDKIVTTPFGQMPGANFLGVLVGDTLTHTWDLSKAAGLPVSLDQELVAVVTQNMLPMDEMIRRPGAFDAKVAPQGDADDQTKLMAFLGRKVQDWA